MHPRRGEEGPFRQEVVTGKVLGDLGLRESGFIRPLQYHFPLPSLDLVFFLSVPLKVTCVSAAGPLHMVPSLLPIS